MATLIELASKTHMAVCAEVLISERIAVIEHALIQTRKGAFEEVQRLVEKLTSLKRQDREFLKKQIRALEAGNGDE